MNKLKSTTKTYILAGTLSLISSIVFCSLLCIVFLNFFSYHNNPTTPEVEPPTTQITPSLNVPTSITLDLLEQGTIIYSLEHIGNYSLSITIEDDSVATISGTTIIPNKIGTTKIVFTINTTPAIVKETTLNIIDCTKEVEFIITTEATSSPEIFYTNTYYFLEVKQNLMPSETPSISYDNLSEFAFIKSQKNSYFFKFKILNAGDFVIYYSGEYINFSKTYFAYKLPSSFNINFSNITPNGNEINLYLFNLSYISIANLDNIFNHTEFEIIPESNTIDDICLKDTYDKNIISVTDNTLTALSTGSTTLEFYSNVSCITICYDINVNEVMLSEILINNTNISLGSTQNIQLASGETFQFIYSAIPTYTLGALSLNYNNNELSFENNNFALFENTETAVITITYKDTVVYTLNISKKLEITHSLKIIQSSYDVAVTDYTLTANYATDFYILINIKAINSENSDSLPYQNFEIKSLTNNICKCTDEKIINGNLTLQILASGICTLIITDLSYNIDIEVTIIIN